MKIKWKDSEQTYKIKEKESSANILNPNPSKNASTLKKHKMPS